MNHGALDPDAVRHIPGGGSAHRQLLAGYSTLEIGLMNCVQVARDDFDAILKAIFWTRSVRHRIDIADAPGRHTYNGLGLRTEFEMAVSAVRYSLRIRNQYAHCVWYDDKSGRLTFVDLEEIAQLNDFVPDLGGLTQLYVDAPLLTAQEEYFVYTDNLLAWVNHEGRARAGTLARNPLPKPKQVNQPALNSP